MTEMEDLELSFITSKYHILKDISQIITENWEVWKANNKKTTFT